MIDDLISRKALLKELELNYGDNDNEHQDFSIGIYTAIKTIKNQPVAFDKEKVIDELEDYLFEKHCIEGDAKIDEIVEKGGLN